MDINKSTVYNFNKGIIAAIILYYQSKYLNTTFFQCYLTKLYTWSLDENHKIGEPEKNKKIYRSL